MNYGAARGILRQGLDSAFEAEELLKSKLILAARLARERAQDETAAAHFAQAAEIEERLSDLCEAKGLLEKSFLHRFSAASCWAQAGNLYRALILCNSLLGHIELANPLRQRAESYAQTLRERRSEWYEDLLHRSPEAEESEAAR